MRTELHELVLALITTLMMQGVAFGTILLDHSIGSNKDVRDRSGEEPRCGRSQAGKTRHDTKRRKSIHYNNKKKNNRRRRRRRVTQEEEEKEEEKEEEEDINNANFQAKRWTCRLLWCYTHISLSLSLSLSSSLSLSLLPHTKKATSVHRHLPHRHRHRHSEKEEGRRRRSRRRRRTEDLLPLLSSTACFRISMDVTLLEPLLVACRADHILGTNCRPPVCRDLLCQRASINLQSPGFYWFFSIISLQDQENRRLFPILEAKKAAVLQCLQIFMISRLDLYCSILINFKASIFWRGLEWHY